MPPLSLTQSKYAFAEFGMSVKSVPSSFVAMPPSLIGVPLAFWPLPRPHFEAAALSPPLAGVLCAELLAPDDDELELDPPPPPQPATVRATAATTAGRTERVRADLRSMRMAPPPWGGFTAVLLRCRGRGRRARAGARRRPAGRASPVPPRGSPRGRADRRPRAGG